MKIAYITTYDSSDINNWSGTGTYILKALQSSNIQTFPIGNLQEDWTKYYQLKKAFYARCFGKKYLRDREPRILKNYAKQVEKALLSIDHDVIFCPGTSPITYLKTKKPIVVWIDSTFAGGKDFLPNYSNLCLETILKGNKTAQIALTNCCLVIFSSEWAANKAIQYYDIEPSKVKVVPFGANVNCSRNLDDIKVNLRGKNFDTCRLLFVGKPWYWKGGDIALQVANELNRRGIKTELHIAGCNPEGNLPDFVKVHGYISKKTDEGRELFDSLFSNSHFFILPTRADCSPIVFAEASSFGLPSLAPNLGGISTMIRNGINGQTFSAGDNTGQYCDYIERIYFSKEDYDELALSSFQEYLERLNWETSGRIVYDLLHEYCNFSITS